MQQQGLFQKYIVRKINNPEKNIDCVCLEFDDPIARIGIAAWAEAMRSQGYIKVWENVQEKLKQIEVANDERKF